MCGPSIVLLASLPLRSIRLAPVLLLAVPLLGINPSGTSPAPLSAQEPDVAVPVTGRTLAIELNDGELASGELIEAADRSLLILGGGGLRSFSLDDIRSARYRRHGFGTEQAVLWVGLGAAITGLGMTAACTQVEDTSCGAVFPVFAVFWGLFGGVFAGYIASGQMQDLDLTVPSLTPYARFPQGAPADFRARQQRVPRPPG